MPPPIPDRYRLEMRLGRDGDIEEWLATDTSLERPVLVRSLGPEAAPERRRAFISSVTGAAKTSHQHLARVFVVEEVEGGAYSVSEWAGGASLADRIGAGRTIDLEEFLPNAAGLYGALSSLHQSGNAHGHIDLSAIAYSVAHPAKLGSFGRPALTDEKGDVRALAGVLETAVTGFAPGGPPPSESIDGFPRALDRILRSGQAGTMSAAEMEKAFLAAPTPRLPKLEPGSNSRKLLLIAAILVVIAIGLVALGRLFIEPAAVVPVATTSANAPITTTPNTETTIPPMEVTINAVTSFDPFGEGGENDDMIPNLTDGSGATTWQTERYPAPIETLKAGVGLHFDVSGTPEALLLIGLAPDTEFEILWAPAVLPLLDGWERLVGAESSQGAVALTLPPRTDGHWLIWFTHLPQQPDGSYLAEVSEVRFSP